MLARLRARIASLLRRHRIEREMDEEWRFHLESRIDALVDRGVGRGAAEHQARCEFGPAIKWREDSRDARGTAWLDGLRRDLVYAVRQCRRAPAFAAVVIATLALGIGATTAVFTIVHAVLLRPLPFADPDHLAVIRLSSGARVSAPYLHDWRNGSRTARDIAGWYDARVTLRGSGTPLEVSVDRATSNFFSVLGVPAHIGRTFTESANLAVVEPEAVLSYGFWQQQFGGDPTVVGRAITLDDTRVTIVGVMPRTFGIRTNELAQSRAQMWLPMPLVPGERRGMGGAINGVLRLADDVSVAQAEAELGAIAADIERAHPSYSRDWRVQVVPLHEATVRDVRLRLMLLTAAVALLLTIACANVAGLMLSRAVARQPDVAVRRSLGASSWQIARQSLSESAVLAIAGGAAGVALAQWGTAALVSALPADLQLPRSSEIGINGFVLAFASAVTLTAVVAAGSLPSLISARINADMTLRPSRGDVTGSYRRRLGSLLVVSELALALALLAGAGLLARSFQSLGDVDLGFRSERVLSLRLSLAPDRYETGDRVRMFANALVDRAAGLPGVQSVGLVSAPPMTRSGRGAPFTILDRPAPPAGDEPGAALSVTGGRYFDALDIRLVRGRLFAPTDTADSPPVVVVDEALARRYWPGQDPLGARISWRQPADLSSTPGALQTTTRIGEIVGVVSTARYFCVTEDATGMMYFWLPQRPERDVPMVMHTTGDPLALGAMAVAEVQAIDPAQAVSDVRPLQAFVADELAPSRASAVAVGAFAIAALLLAAVGLYGLIAFDVACRTREFGVRMALGARRMDVLRLVLLRGIRLVSLGVVVGLAIALGLGRVMAGLLYGVSASDPGTLVLVAVTLSTVAIVATMIPARRATRVEPVEALRLE
ncbi:MAG: ABC transporter permease [Acidobacteria bacterium]|nr:ABC transporter permease [Acidobacteriota bacterium]